MSISPVIDAIEAGHVNHGNVCRFDQETWPCSQIESARELARVLFDANMRTARLTTPLFLEPSH